MINWIYESLLRFKISSEENGYWPLLIIGAKITGINVSAYFLSNYDKVFGSMLSIASFVYVCIKIYKECKSPNKSKNK